MKTQKRKWVSIIAGCVLIAMALAGVVKTWTGDNIAAGDSVTRSNVALPSRMIAEAGSEERAALLKELHTDCFNGNLPACERLLHDKQIFKLDDNYSRHYSEQACSLGGRQHCTGTK